MSIKSGYKQTEIGIIPEDWKIIPLNDLVYRPLAYGVLKPGEYEENGVYMLRIQDIKTKTIDYKSLFRIPESLDFEFKRTKLNEGDLILSLVGTIGKVLRINNRLAGANVTRAFGVIGIKEKDSINYIEQYLNSNVIQKWIEEQARGNAQKVLNIDNLKKMPVIFPPIEEQKKIADILSTVDKKIAFVEENINATEELKKGLMQKLLTEGIGHTEFKDSELGRIPESWEVKSFYNIASIKHGYAFKSESFSSIETDNVVLTPGNVKIGGGYNHKYFRFYDNTYFPEEYILKKNDLIISMTDLTPNSATLGYPFFVPEIKNKKFLHNQRLGKVEINFLNIDKVFLFNFLCTDTYRNNIVSEATGTTVKHTSPTRILSQLIPIPPLEEQKQIAEILSTVDKKIENLKEKKQSFEELKKGLMQKLLTGEVRV